MRNKSGQERNPRPEQPLTALAGILGCCGARHKVPATSGGCAVVNSVVQVGGDARSLRCRTANDGCSALHLSTHFPWLLYHRYAALHRLISVELAPELVKVAQDCPSSAQNWPASLQIGQRRSRIGPSRLAEFDPELAKFAPNQSKSLRIWSKSPKIVRV